MGVNLQPLDPRAESVSNGSAPRFLQEGELGNG